MKQGVYGRLHGDAPYHLVVVHGGPGAPGSMGPAARELATDRGVLEPFQSERSVDGQVEELAEALRSYASPPVIVIGHSWGAWLSLMLAARHPEMVAKVVLVSSGVLDISYLAAMQANRRARLTPREQAEWDAAIAALEQDAPGNRDLLLARLGALGDRTDGFDEVFLDDDQLDVIEGAGGQGEIYASVWPEAAEMRATGKLIRLVSAIRCPVVAIHGDSDPSPAAGVELPLREVLIDFRMRILARCGHTPWRERHARPEFFRVLREELG